jgi:hypothetical protein
VAAASARGPIRERSFVRWGTSAEVPPTKMLEETLNDSAPLIRRVRGKVLAKNRISRETRSKNPFALDVPEACREQADAECPKEG